MNAAQSKRIYGFTLIELLLVIAIIGIMIFSALPAYNHFNNTQQLKKGALILKDNLRLMQTRANTGEKNCPFWDTNSDGNDDNRLTGWYLTLSSDNSSNTSYNLAGRCMYDASGELGSDFTFGTAESKLPQNVVIEEIKVNGSILTGNKLAILFLAVNQGIKFYDGSITDSEITGVTSVVVTLNHIRIGEKYTVTITPVGNIYETKI